MAAPLLTGNGLTLWAPPKPVDHVTAVDGNGSWRLRATRGRLLPVIEWGTYAAWWNLAALWVVIKVARDVSGVGALPITLGLAAVGLGVGFLVTRAFWRRLAYAYFPPPFSVALAAPQALRGRPLTLHWQSRSDRPRTPRISVVLFEECVFEDATERITDRHEVREVPCAMEETPGGEGRCTLLVPADLPSSFRGSNNQLLWCVRVRWGRRGIAHFPLPVGLAETGSAAALAPVAEIPVTAGEAPLELARTADGTVAGIARAPAGTSLRLCWQVVGKGNSERGEVAALILPADIPTTGAAFTATLPVQPPAWRGTLLTVGWVVELVGSDGKLVKRQWVPDP